MTSGKLTKDSELNPRVQVHQGQLNNQPPDVGSVQRVLQAWPLSAKAEGGEDWEVMGMGPDGILEEGL